MREPASLHTDLTTEPVGKSLEVPRQASGTDLYFRKGILRTMWRMDWVGAGMEEVAILKTKIG